VYACIKALSINLGGGSEKTTKSLNMDDLIHFGRNGTQ
jgi:chromosome segregation ATPase